jgi:hypothetical protein
MHDHFKIVSYEGILTHTRMVIAADKEDAARCHEAHYPGIITGIFQQGRCRGGWR